MMSDNLGGGYSRYDPVIQSTTTGSAINVTTPSAITTYDTNFNGWTISKTHIMKEADSGLFEAKVSYGIMGFSGEAFTTTPELRSPSKYVLDQILPAEYQELWKDNNQFYLGGRTGGAPALLIEDDKGIYLKNQVEYMPLAIGIRKNKSLMGINANIDIGVTSGFGGDFEIGAIFKDGKYGTYYSNSAEWVFGVKGTGSIYLDTNQFKKSMEILFGED